MGHINLALLGVLGLVQTVFLPGYLILRFLRVGRGLIAGCVLSFGLSLLANYLLVTGSVVVGVYRPEVIYSIFAVELMLWLWLDRARLQAPLSDAISRIGSQTRTFFRNLDHSSQIRSHWLRLALIAVAMGVACGFAAAGLAEFGRVFQQWDAVVSWNRWAIEWAANRPPQLTSYYPQLLPANISLSYVFMQTSQVWIFAKAMQFLFCLMLLLAMLDAARLSGSSGILLGVAITYGLLVALLRYRMLSSGYADAPLAFFAWMPIYALLQADRAEEPTHRLKWLFVGALFAAGAALTKQLGLYVAAVYPILTWIWALHGCRVGRVKRVPPNSAESDSWWDSLRSAHPTCLYLLIVLLVAPWYVYKFTDIRSGHDVNNTQILVRDAHEGRDLRARLAYAGGLLADATTLPGGALLLVAVAASLGDRRMRWMLGLFVLPLGLLWAAAFSYDLRNLAMLAPFVGAATGTGLVRIICWMECKMGRGGEREKGRCGASTSPAASKFAHRRTTFRAWHTAGLGVVVLIASTLCVRDETLLSLQRRQLRQVGISDLNDRLYAFSQSSSDRSLIATDYLALCWLPDLGPRSVACAADDLATFRKSFDRADVRYVLVRTAAESEKVRGLLAQPTAARLLFEEHGYAFYEKVTPAA